MCFAQAGDNRVYHSIFGGPQGCYSIHPSDTAIALSALNASVVTTSGTYTMDKFFSPAAPGNNLAQGELIKEIDVPTPATGSKSGFYKVARGNSFALASAGCLVHSGDWKHNQLQDLPGRRLAGAGPRDGSGDHPHGDDHQRDHRPGGGPSGRGQRFTHARNSYKKQIATTAIARALQA